MSKQRQGRKKQGRVATETKTDDLMNRLLAGRIGVLSSFLVFAIAYHALNADYFPRANGLLGHDYAYIVPRFVAGAFWFKQNSLFSIPWFTPAFCGGVPLFADPQSFYFSLAQWFSLLIDPVSAIYLGNFVVGMLGFWGVYFLLTRSFQCAKPYATLGAGLFLLNGFFSSRMIVGHFGFHAFMLIPMLAYLVLKPHSSRWGLAGNICTAGLIFAYMLHGGFAGLMPAGIFSVVLIGLLHHAVMGPQKMFWLRLGLAGLVGVAIGLAKLFATMNYMSRFPRSLYTMSGVESIFDLISMIFAALFISPYISQSTPMTQIEFQLSPNEFDYGITMVPVLLVIAAVWTLLQRRQNPVLGLKRHWLWWTLLLLGALVPFALNFHTPGWNQFLKSLPLIGVSLTQLRWIAVLIPISCMGSVLAFDRVRFAKGNPWFWNAIATILIIVLHGTSNREAIEGGYAKFGYNAKWSTKALTLAKETDTIPPIRMISDAVKVPVNGRELQINSNDGLAMGLSPIECYEPIFGYRREHFPKKTLALGPIETDQGTTWNMKNPACYLFPAENSCQPGDHFLKNQTDQLRQFAAYRTFEYASPPSHGITKAISLMAFLLSLGVIAVNLVLLARARLK